MSSHSGTPQHTGDNKLVLQCLLRKIILIQPLLNTKRFKIIFTPINKDNHLCTELFHFIVSVLISSVLNMVTMKARMMQLMVSGML